MPPAPGQEEPINRMVKIVNSFLARDDVAPFSEPVDWRGMELYDYPEIIEKMMDLGTIKRRLERGQYTTAHEVGEDIRLVFTNCMTYNADGSDFWLLAKAFFVDLKIVTEKFDTNVSAIDDKAWIVGLCIDQCLYHTVDVGEDFGDAEDGEDPDPKAVSTAASGSKSKITSTSKETVPSAEAANTAPLDVRARFGANLFLLSGVELGMVFSDLELNCPQVLEPWGESKIEINVDEIPPKVFARLQKYVNGLVDSTAEMQEDSALSGPKKKKRKST